MYLNYIKRYMNQAGDPGPSGGPAGDPPATPPAGDPPATPPAGDPPATPPATPPAGDPPASFFKSVPDDWREQLVGDDEAKLNQLKRIPDFGTFANNYFAAQDKIRTGLEPIKPPGEDASDEDRTAYREAMGVPEKAEDYSLSLDDGLVLGPEDEAIMPEIYKAAHEANVSPDVVSKLANAMLNGRELEIDKMRTEQAQHQHNATAALKETWQGDYETNLNMVRNTILGGLPEDIREEFEHAMMPNGRKIFNSPEIMVLFADVARKVDPAATVVPSGGNPIQTINDEIASLEKRMGESGWHKDTAAQQRYQLLVDARDKLS